MDLTKLAGADEALKAVRANTSPRAAYLGILEAYVEGTQYDGLPDWFSDACPLWGRAPCIVYPVVKSAIDSNTDLVLGEGRFPSVTTHPDEDDGDFDDAALDEDDSIIVDRFIGEIVRQVRFKSACREIFSAAQGCGAGVSIYGVRAGRLFMDTTKSRWCTPKFGHEGNLVALTIAYPYLEQYQDLAGKWSLRAKLYKRIIDAVSDTTFLPADAETSGIQPSWQPDPLQTFQHGFGFCPAHWYPFMRGCSAVNDFDGKAIHANILDEVRALDFALSQRHRAALYCGDPQWTEIGVELGSSPTPKVRGMSMPSTSAGGVASASNPITGGYREPGRMQMGRKKSPGDVWQYEDPDAKVHLHTLPGDALKALDDHARDLRMKIAESMAVVFLDPDHVKLTGAALSGKALEAMKQRQLDRCDQYRSDIGDRLLVPSIEMLLRVVKTTADRGANLQLGGMDKAMPVLAKFEVSEPTALLMAAQ